MRSHNKLEKLKIKQIAKIQIKTLDGVARGRLRKRGKARKEESLKTKKKILNHCCLSRVWRWVTGALRGRLALGSVQCDLCYVLSCLTLAKIANL